MGHRALVAYEREHGYDLHYSHWGGADLALQIGIAAETPFGRTGDEPGQVAAVDPDPMATGLSRSTVLDSYLDFREYEAFYVVSPDYDVTTYRTLWFGLCHVSDAVRESDASGNGALVAVPARDLAADGFLQGWFRGMKTTVGDTIDRGALSESSAREYLAARVEDSWDDREVIVVR